MEELEEEVKERDKLFNDPFASAVRLRSGKAVLERILRAWSGTVNAQRFLGLTPIMNAVFHRQVDDIQTVATMGADLSITEDTDRNVSEFVAEFGNSSPAKKSSIYAALAEHGVTSSRIPPGFQSPL
jgi:hypothetical protein